MHWVLAKPSRLKKVYGKFCLLGVIIIIIIIIIVGLESPKILIHICIELEVQTEDEDMSEDKHTVS